MVVKSSNVKVRWQPQWKPHATKPIITGYIVYAYVGLPAFEVLGTRSWHKTESAARKQATLLRKQLGGK